MNINNFVDFCNQIFPFKNSIDGDKVGLQLLNKRKYVNKVLFTLEITFEVIEEAKLLDIDTIISFHPLIYKSFNLSTDERVGNLIKELIISDINVLVIHTNFDTYEYGTNYIFAKVLGLNVVDFLFPLNKTNTNKSITPNQSENSNGMGLICKASLSKSTEVNSEKQLGYWVEKISNLVNSPIKFTNSESGIVNNIAIICGSGSSFLEDIINENEKLSNEDRIDTFITADISYHTFHKCKGYINLIDVGHYEMEQFVPNAMFNILKTNFNSNYNSNYNNYSNSNIAEEDKIKFYLSKVLTNPVDYYPNKNFKENQLNYLLNH